MIYGVIGVNVSTPGAHRLTLATPYQGTTNGVASYSLTVDFTPTLGLPLIYGGDLGTRVLWRYAMEILDTLQVGSGTGTGTGAPTNAAYLTLSHNTSLSAERVLRINAPWGSLVTDGGPGGYFDLNVPVADNATALTATSNAHVMTPLRVKEYVDSRNLQPIATPPGVMTPRAGSVNLSGGLAGNVLTVQANGSLALSAPTAAAVSVAQYKIVGSLTAGTVPAIGLGSGDIPLGTWDNDDDSVLGWESGAGGALRRFRRAEIGAGGGASAGEREIVSHAVSGGARVVASDDANPSKLIQFTGSGDAVLRLPNSLTTNDELHVMCDPSPTSLTIGLVASAGSHAMNFGLGSDQVTDQAVDPRGYYRIKVRQNSDGTSAKYQIYAEVAGALTGVTGTGSDLNPVTDSTDYSSTPFTVTPTFNEHRFFTGAQNHIVHFPTGLSPDPAAHGRLTAPPLNTLSIRAATSVSINGQAGNGTAILWTVPATGTVEWLVRTTNTIEVLGDIAAGTLDAAKSAIGNYRQVVRRVTSSAALTLDATTYPGGCTVVYTGTGTSLVLPSRLTASETGVSEAIVFHHRGASGTLTISTTGSVSRVGNATILFGNSATIEWDHDGTTQRVTVRSTG